MRWIPFILLMALGAFSFRADDPPKPKPDDANKPVQVDAAEKAALEAALGKDVIVTGTIKKAQWSNTGKVMNIDFDPHQIPVFFDKEAFHRARGGKKGVNYLYADGHIKNLLAIEGTK